MSGAVDTVVLCKRGHEMTPENTYTRPTGKTSCRTCRRQDKNPRKAGAPRKLSSRVTCASPGCDRPAGHGFYGDFCEVCMVVLDRVRDLFEAEMKGARKKMFGGKGPKCCTPGCDEPRDPGESFCDLCVAT